MPIKFGYPNISLLSSSSSSINNNINIENVINENNTMMMNASAASYHLDHYVNSSSHSKEPPSQTVNVDVFGSRNKKNTKKNGKNKNIDEENPKSTKQQTWTVHMSNLKHDTHDITKVC
jgi:hypothetical protein